MFKSRRYFPGDWQRQAVAVMHLWREVADTNQLLIKRGCAAEESDDVTGRVVGFDPLEARWVGVRLPQRRLLLIEAVQFADELLDATVKVVVEQVPV